MLTALPLIVKADLLDRIPVCALHMVGQPGTAHGCGVARAAALDKLGGYVVHCPVELELGGQHVDKVQNRSFLEKVLVHGETLAAGEREDVPCGGSNGLADIPLGRINIVQHRGENLRLRGCTGFCRGCQTTPTRSAA